MSAGQRYRTILSVLLPAGALGMSLLLGATTGQAAREASPGVRADAAPVSERLAAIRDAVSDVSGTEPARSPGEAERLAWANWPNINLGVPLPFWPLWNDWHNGWKNCGNHWHNAWDNWPNGWHNGWHNF